MRVVIRAGASRDLRAIGDWIARDNPRRAETFVVEREARAMALAAMPRRGPVVARTRLGPVRKLTHGSYLIYYRVRTNAVDILAVRHAAMGTPDFD